MQLPSLTVHYEDFQQEQGWNTTVNRMLTLLKQNARCKKRFTNLKYKQYGY
jgi:hypothetical protein